MSKSDTLSISIPVSMSKIHNTLISGFEGGANYWLREDDLVEGFRKPDSKLVWYGHEEVFRQPFKAKLRFDDPKKDEGNGAAVREITNKDLQRGLELMATKAPQHFSDMVTDQGDSTTGDVLLQMIVLGDIVYG
ncbi:conserved hypothetical protein [Hyphomicrobiales bacterium]|nr:conserved hypothetical protein [Hyphomicrobiales bacterium]CAH1702257.1 conserved hypothetical protein [Hyphomicrobiales bacterium]CAI0346460.1 conserved hypothetical protein [Hyphomicrobiales bacterium]